MSFYCIMETTGCRWHTHSSKIAKHVFIELLSPYLVWSDTTGATSHNLLLGPRRCSTKKTFKNTGDMMSCLSCCTIEITLKVFLLPLSVASASPSPPIKVFRLLSVGPRCRDPHSRFPLSSSFFPTLLSPSAYSPPLSLSPGREVLR